jgi:hypothetical protein
MAATSATHGATGAAKSPKDAANDELHEASKELLTLMDGAGIVDLWRNDLKIGAAMGRLHHAVIATTPPPTVVTAPYAEQSVDLLTCTMGTWTNEPSSYAYQWQRDGVNIPAGSSAQYLVTAADVGHSCTCIVTATNAAGSASSTSNAVSPTGAAGATGATGATGTTGTAR